MKRLIYLAGVALVATLLLTACSSDGDNTPTPPTPPTPEKTEPAEGTDLRPTWQAPDYSAFEGMTMVVQIGIQEELQPYVSANDLMCAQLKGEVRALGTLHETAGQYYFPLSILGNSSEGAVTLKYYCDKLHRIFTVEGWKKFDSTILPTQGGEPYEVKFYTGD